MPQENTSVPKIKVARYAAPTVRAVKVTGVITSKPLDNGPLGAYQTVLLNPRTGELKFHENAQCWEPWNPAWKSISDVPREIYERWHPGKFFSGVGPHMWFEPVPELLSWTIDSGVPGLPYLNTAAANALLEELTPYAQQLTDNLFEAGGDLDWSADSARAGRNIRRLCSRHREARPPEADGDLVDYGEIVNRFPQAYRPELLRGKLDQLADGCESITRFLGFNEPWHEEIKKVFGAPYSDGSGIRLDVLGVRAWYRTVLQDGDPRPLQEFATWDAEHGRLTSSGITSTSTDSAVEAWADREEGDAARQGWRLLHVQEAGYQYREQVRARDWDRLAVVGADVAWMEDETDHVQDELDSKRAERLALVTATIRWGRTDNEIAVRARLTRRAVFKIRESVSDAMTGCQSR